MWEGSEGGTYPTLFSDVSGVSSVLVFWVVRSFMLSRISVFFAMYSTAASLFGCPLTDVTDCD